MSEWISVDLMLPDVGSPVLAIVRGECYIAGVFDESADWEKGMRAYTYWDDYHNDGQVWEHDDVTHWMALPDKPEDV